jgi:ATP phosphoribosyltransferase
MRRKKMNIKIEISAPGLEKALNNLADAIGGKGLTTHPEAPAQEIQETVQQPAQYQQPVQPTQQPVPTAVPTAQQQAPTQQTQPQGVPTTAPSYTMDQLAVASTQLVDAGRREELLQLLSSFGASALMQLPKEQYGAFATKLREMGAKI